MAEITVRAETNTLGMRAGDEQTVEDTPFLRNVIAGGRLSLVESTTCADTAASQPAPDVAGMVDAPPEQPAPEKGKRGRREAEQLDDLEGDLAAVVDVRPPADARVTVRPPEYPPAA